jgi:LemA protein
MTLRNRGWVIVLAILVVLFLYGSFTYNGLVRRDERVKQTWGNLQNSYQRRMDLIPSLVAVVKGSSDYEKQTLQQIAEARAKAQQVAMTTGAPNAENYSNQENAQAEMVNSVNRLIAVIERYPNLQSTRSFLYLQSQLEGSERRIRVARGDFNGAVAQYNKRARGFPSGLVASLFGFHSRDGFTSDSGASQAPEVKF